MKNYLSLIKFSHTIFALPFALIGFFLGTHYYHYPFSSKKLLLVIGCMVFARSAAMAFNRYIDSHIDSLNPRTANREIPKGIISKTSALGFIAINIVLFIVCSYFLATPCFYLSPVALFIILGYSYTKRFTAWCHIILGLGLGLAPLGANIAVTEQFLLIPLLFSLVVIFWVSGFDIIYALQDKDFDKNNSLHSLPAYLGKTNALRISTILHVLCASVVVFIGIYGKFNIVYWIGAGLFISMLSFQHSIVSANNLSKVNTAFFTTNGVASIIFATFTIISLLYS